MVGEFGESPAWIGVNTPYCRIEIRWQSRVAIKLADRHIEGGKLKKMVSPSVKRRAVNHVIEQGIGNKSQACRALGLARSSAYLGSRVSARNKMLYRKIVDQSKDQPRYGYRRVTALIRKDGETINWKRVQRVRRKECLQVSRRQRKIRRVGHSTVLRQHADHPRHVWSWDFVEDQTENGSRFRILTIIDVPTNEETT